LCKAGKVVWIGDLLIEGEQWCLLNRIEPDYTVTLTIADQHTIAKEAVALQHLYGVSRESLNERLVLESELKGKQIPPLTNPKML